MNIISWLKMGTGITLAIGLAWFGWYFHTLVATSHDYASLKEVNSQLVMQHAQDSSSAAKAAIQLVANEAYRNQMQKDFDDWKAAQLKYTSSLRGMINASPVSTNVLCSPTAPERKLWNDSLAQLTGNQSSR